MHKPLQNATHSSLKIKIIAPKYWHRINYFRIKRRYILQASGCSFYYHSCHRTCLTDAAQFGFKVWGRSIFIIFCKRSLLATNCTNFTSKQKGYKLQNFNTNTYSPSLNTIQHSCSRSTHWIAATLFSQSQWLWTRPAELYKKHPLQCCAPATGKAKLFQIHGEIHLPSTCTHKLKLKTLPTALWQDYGISLQLRLRTCVKWQIPVTRQHCLCCTECYNYCFE